jgi:hypothetical protein
MKIDLSSEKQKVRLLNDLIIVIFFVYLQNAFTKGEVGNLRARKNSGWLGVGSGMSGRFYSL